MTDIPNENIHPIVTGMLHEATMFSIRTRFDGGMVQLLRPKTHDRAPSHSHFFI
jgi:hypothetical protein